MLFLDCIEHSQKLSWNHVWEGLIKAEDFRITTKFSNKAWSSEVAKVRWKITCAAGMESAFDILWMFRTQRTFILHYVKSVARNVPY